MAAQHSILGLQVRDRSSNPTNPIQCPDAQSKLLDRSNQMAEVGRPDLADVPRILDIPTGDGIRRTRSGQIPCLLHSATNRPKILHSSRRIKKPVERWRLHLNLKIETIQHRTSDAFQTVTTMPTPSIHSSIRIHRRHHQRLCRHSDRACGPCDGDDPVLERFSQSIDRRPCEFRELIQQEDASVRQADLPGPRDGPPTDHRDRTAGVMRRSKGWHPETWDLGRQSGCRTNHRHFQGGCIVERWKNPGQAASQHGLPTTRRAAEQKVVPPGGSDLNRPGRCRLANDPSQSVITSGLPRCSTFPLGGIWRDPLMIGEKCHDLDQIASSEDRDPWDQRGFSDAFFSDDDAIKRETTCQDRHGDRPTNRTNRSIQCQFTAHQPAIDSTASSGLRRDHPGTGEGRHRDRQVVDRPFLPSIRRGQIHGQTVARPFEASVADRGSNPLGGFPNRRIRETYDPHRGKTMRREIDLDATRLGGGADEHETGCGTKHPARLAVQCTLPDWKAETRARFSGADEIRPGDRRHTPTR